MQAERFIVIGKVQGVGFRRFVADMAQDIGAAGYVRNRRDGSVEIVLTCASDEVLDRFANALNGGPGHVERILRNSEPQMPEIEGFEIRATI